MTHLWALGRKILKHAQKIIFITPNAQQSALQHPVLRSVRDVIANNSIVISNGIDPFWNQNITHKQSGKTPLSILYVGNFEYYKNIPLLIAVCLQAQKRYPDLHLNLVGGGGSQQKEVEALIQEHHAWITFRERVTDKECLKEIYRNNDIFAMVSRETFGLVYIEALTQGLPLIYAENGGFYNLYEEGHVGYSVDPQNTDSILNTIQKIVDNYDTLIDNISHCDFNRYDWNAIAKQYIDELKMGSY